MCRAGLIALAWFVAISSVISGTPAANAGAEHNKVVSDNPVDWTPHVLDGIVLAFATVGNTVVVGGDFRRVSEADGSGEISQRHLFAFDRTTGRISRSFRPELDGPVLALATGADGTVYAGGRFGSVNGASQVGLTRLRVSDGARTESSTGIGVQGGDVRALAVHGDDLYVGGTFTAIGGQSRTALARVDTSNDKVDAGFDMRLSKPRAGRLRVESLAISPGGGRLVITGTFTAVMGQARHQIAMVDTSASPARVDRWSTGVYEPSCGREFASYLRGIDFSPDGSYFVVTTTGGHFVRYAMCNTAARFETRPEPEAKPTWTNHTGGDSLYAVAITGAAVYVGGHQRWLNNPYGHEDAGRGAVSRPGIGAIDPRTGKALSWNPTRPRGVGVKALLATPGGLWVGSDTDQLGREYHARIGMFPLQ